MYLLIIAGLYTRYISVTLEKDELKTRYDQLNNSYSQLQELMSIDYSQLQSSYKILRENHSQLQEEVKQLRDKIEGKWCPDGWRRFGGSCYFKSDEKESWEGSRDYCRQRGADLVVINSKEEQKFVTELSVDGESWIGLQLKWTEGEHAKWEWVDTSPLTEMFWTPGLPEYSLYRQAVTCCNQQGQWTQSLSEPECQIHQKSTREQEEEEEEQVEISEDEEHHADLRSHEANPHTHNNPVAVKRRCFSAATVTLGVMYLLIFAGLYTRYISVTWEKDELQTRYDQLSNNYSQLQELMSRKNVDCSQLQSSYEALSRNQSQLQDEVKQLRDKTEGKWCPDGWRRFGCSCYFKSDEQKSWEGSREECQQRGADLVVINSKEEQKFVIELNVRGDSWIGLWEILTDREYIWEWVDGSPQAQTFWAPGLPQDDNYRQAATCCNQQGQWTQSDYFIDKSWICEK
ncbi:asialoglycoprotein receptor 2-like isoform X2 [Plectropomus leopardus]|uniref:asialoglycoprotein receptor 2-like isoform X2 n=1 Tax=Plectropomus leopardus TaxID=160734 RepID=UPI001C4C8BB8|nr:asialoglycoprotein receptor 2-like isoform X2 [Plectropomus leopardus]